MNKTIEQVIAERGFYVTKPKGMSMFPLFRDRNCDAYIVRPELPLKKYDVPVYRRDDGTYVMHRVLSVGENGYVCCGDNQWVLEKDVRDNQIVGVLDSWYKKSKKHTVRDASYLRYVRFWCMSLGLRRVMLFFARAWMRLVYYTKIAIRKFSGVFKRR